MFNLDRIEHFGGKNIFVTIVILNVLMILLFSVSYFLIGQIEGTFRGVEKQMSILDAFYFTVVNQTTLGYGDITPVSGTAKIMVILQELIFIGEVIFLASL